MSYILTSSKGFTQGMYIGEYYRGYGDTRSLDCNSYMNLGTPEMQRSGSILSEAMLNIRQYPFSWERIVLYFLL